MKELSKTNLGKLYIERSGSGFTIWAREKNKDGSISTHWVIDASCINEDGLIRAGSKGIYNIEATFDKQQNAFIVKDRARKIPTQLVKKQDR